MAPEIKWDAFKAWIRGEYIACISSVQREATRSLGNLEEAERLERIYVDSPTELNYHSWQLVLREFSLYRVEQSKKSILHSAQRVFKYGDKNGRLLAWLARGQVSSTHIANIQDEGGQLITSPEGINARFSQFFRYVYSSRAHYSPSELQSYLDHIVFPLLEDSSREALETDITL